MQRRSHLSWPMRTARIVLLAFGLTPILLYLYFLGFGILKGDSYLFQPSFVSYDDSEEILKVPVGEGETLSGLWLPNSNAVFTVLHSHGNAEDIGFLRSYLEDVVDHGFSVFAYDFRGYGTSMGTPSVKSAEKDAEAAFRYLTTELGVSPEKIIVHGRSVGAALAILLARDHPVAGLVSESGFTSAFRVVTGVRIFPFDKFPNLSRIENVQCPKLFLHGTADGTIPVWHSEALYTKAPELKRAVWIEGGDHDNLLWVGKEQYWKAWEEFQALLMESRG